MSQALYTSMGGINAATTSLQVISNNIANINTTAFKKSSVGFSDVFYRTMSSGSVATNSSGGTNPVQIGVGTKVSSISKDFTTGSWVSTGKATDLMIEGSGFFSVTDGTSTFYTRAGNFSFDEDGNLVTAEGYRILGTDSIMSTTLSSSTVKVPLSICADVSGNTNINAVQVTDLNSIASNLTQGDFVTTISYVNGAGATVDVPCTITLASSDLSGNVSNLTTNLQTKMNASFVVDGTTYTVSNLAVSTAGGKITFDIDGATHAAVTTGGDTFNITALSFSTPTTASTAAGISNFVTQTSLKGATPTDGVYSTKILDKTVVVSQLSSASEAISETAETINGDGSIQVTYNDGSILSVQLGADGATYEFIYTTSDNVKITGSKCTVDDNVAVASNFVIQMATITNTNGLLSIGSNLYEAGPNSGTIVYTVAGEMGAGNLESGGLEASNVDLSEELSNMILAQRAVEANSRVFTTTSDVMSTIVNMGR